MCARIHAGPAHHPRGQNGGYDEQHRRRGVLKSACAAAEHQCRIELGKQRWVGIHDQRHVVERRGVRARCMPSVCRRRPGRAFVGWVFEQQRPASVASDGGGHCGDIQQFRKGGNPWYGVDTVAVVVGAGVVDRVCHLVDGFGRGGADDGLDGDTAGWGERVSLEHIRMEFAAVGLPGGSVRVGSGLCVVCRGVFLLLPRSRDFERA